VARILGHLPTTGRFLEPFTGSAAVAINASHAGIVAADRNRDLISLYNHVTHETEAVLQHCASLFTPGNNSEVAFRKLREEFNHDPSPTLRRSALFIYLNRHAFNGLCRYNSKGQFNVPFGRYKAPRVPEAEIRVFAQRAQRIQFRLGDFETLMDEAGPGDAVYCDPPYVPISASASFTSYEKGGFGVAEQARLAAAARQAASLRIYPAQSPPRIKGPSFIRSRHRNAAMTSGCSARKARHFNGLLFKSRNSPLAGCNCHFHDDSRCQNIRSGPRAM
jgi:DNA adenine methylase